MTQTYRPNRHFVRGFPSATAEAKRIATWEWQRRLRDLHRSK